MLTTLGLALGGCVISPERADCEIDLDCPDDQVCYEDGRCLPVDAARQLGATVGDECFHSGGAITGCNFTCIMQLCDGPPEFEGAEAVVSDGPTALIVRWQPPRDETPLDALVFRVFSSTTPGGQDFDVPTITTTGGTSIRLEGLSPQRPYYVVVRVEDGLGQMEENTHEARGVPGCIEHGTQIAPLLADHCTGCHGEERAERGLRLDSWSALREGAPGRPLIVECRSERSRIVARAGEPPALDTRGPHGGLAPDELDLLRAWIDQGAQESCPFDPTVCADDAAPSFAGVTSATAIDASTVELCWDAGSDDRTPPAELVYDVYEAPAGSPSFTSAPGESCVTLSGLLPAADYCWVVRARDGSGNEDDNTVESCLTTPAATCLEYAEVIQPLFDARCIHCHGGDAPLFRLSLSSYEGVMRGGASGEIALPCDPDASLLLSRLGADPPRGIRMPGDGPPYLTDAQIAAIRRWLAEGARASCAEAGPC